MEYEESEKIKAELSYILNSLYQFHGTIDLSALAVEKSIPTIGMTEREREQMEQELIKLIYNSMKKYQIPTPYFIEKVVEILVSYQHLHQYVKKIEFQGNGTDAYASYNSETGTLNTFCSLFGQTLIPPTSFNILEKKYFPYEQIAYFIGHEIEHANQAKMHQSDEKDLGTELVKLSHKPFIQLELEYDKSIHYSPLLFWLCDKKLDFLYFLYEKRYNKYWEYVPTERLANIRGYNLSIDLIEQFHEFQSLTNLRNYFLRKLQSVVFFGCENIEGASIYYLEKHRLDPTPILEKAKNFSMVERLYFGLPITEKEKKTAIENRGKVLEKIRKMH